MLIERRVLTAILIAGLGLISIIFSLSTITDLGVKLEEIHVGRDLQVDSIQLAIDLASEGTTIIVHQGEYHERLMISKGITLKAASGESFTLLGGGNSRGPPGSNGTMVTIASSTPVTIDGGDYNFSGTTWNDSAIKIQHGDHHVVKNANFFDSRQGVWVHGNDHDDLSTIKNIRILDNTFNNISGHAIYLQGTWAEVENNRINNSGDGIMVAFGWIAQNSYVGSISNNRIENCSVGVNIIGSEVYNYEENDIVDCEVGEILNNTKQLSKGNSFIRCQNGTMVIEDSTPMIVENNYVDCQIPVVIEKCNGLRAYENEIIGTEIGFKPIFEEVSHLDHNISMNNTIDGNPIFYSFGDSGISMDLDDYGQVFIANSTSSTYLINGPTSCPMTVAYSEDIDISGSRITSGAQFFNSIISGDDIEFDYSDHMGTSLMMRSSDLKLYNSRIDGRSEERVALNIDEGSDAGLYSCEIVGLNIINDAASRIRFYSNIDLKVLHEDGIDPVEGAQFKIDVENSTVHSTPLFEGIEPLTGPDGMSEKYWIKYLTRSASTDTEHSVEFTVNATLDRSWEGNRSVDASRDHTEEFIIGDIRRPSTPKNLQGESVPDGESNRLTWDVNTDDTVSYRIYSLENENWTQVGEVTENVFDDSTTPHGTLANYRITAVDEVGLESPPSTSVEVMAQDFIGPKPPRDLRIFDITEDRFTLSWKISLSPDAEMYEVHLVEADMTRSPGSVKSSVRIVSSTADTTIVIQDMSDPENIFAVRAIDEAGNPSPFSNHVSLEANDLTWPTFSNLEWIFGAKTAKISWETNEPTTCTLFLGSSVEDLSAHGPTTLGKDHFFQVDNLLPNTTYYFYIFAVEPSGNDVTDDNEGAFYSFTTLLTEGYLAVTVQDEDSEPVSGITVLLKSGSIEVIGVETEPGIYEAFLLPGNWTITILSSDHSEHDPEVVEVLPFRWTNITIDLTSILWERANLTIIVVDENGNTVQWAVVDFDGKESITGPDGTVIIENVKTGVSYRIKVSADGFENFEKELFIPAKGVNQSETITIIHREEGSSDGSWIWILLLTAAVLLLIIILIIIMLVVKRRKDHEEEPEEPAKEIKEEKEEAEEEGEVKEGSMEEATDVKEAGIVSVPKKGLKKKSKKQEE